MTRDMQPFLKYTRGTDTPPIRGSTCRSVRCSFPWLFFWQSMLWLVKTRWKYFPCPHFHSSEGWPTWPVDGIPDHRKLIFCPGNVHGVNLTLNEKGFFAIYKVFRWFTYQWMYYGTMEQFLSFGVCNYFPGRLAVRIPATLGGKVEVLVVIPIQ